MNRRNERNQRVVRKDARTTSRVKSSAPARLPLRARAGAWRDQHMYSFFSSLGRLAARPWATVLTVLVLGFALALPLLFYLVFDNARDLSGGLREAREVTVFLKPDLDMPQAEAFAGELRRREDVGAVTLRTPAEGLAEFRSLSGFDAALDVLQTNPLPSVLVVTPRADDGAEAPRLVAELKADRRTDLVQYDAAWRRRLAGILEFTERVVAVVAVLLGVATLLVIGNTVRLDVLARAEEISVMQLVGASHRFVRRPFLYTGFWYGLLGGACALIIVALIEFALAAPLASLSQSYGGRFALHGIAAAGTLLLMFGSATLGWLGAFIATTRHLATGRPR